MKKNKNKTKIDSIQLDTIQNNEPFINSFLNVNVSSTIKRKKMHNGKSSIFVGYDGEPIIDDVNGDDDDDGKRSESSKLRSLLHLKPKKKSLVNNVSSTKNVLEIKQNTFPKSLIKRKSTLNSTERDKAICNGIFFMYFLHVICCQIVIYLTDLTYTKNENVSANKNNQQIYANPSYASSEDIDSDDDMISGKIYSINV